MLKANLEVRGPEWARVRSALRAESCRTGSERNRRNWGNSGTAIGASGDDRIRPDRWCRCICPFFKRFILKFFVVSLKRTDSPVGSRVHRHKQGPWCESIAVLPVCVWRNNPPPAEKLQSPSTLPSVWTVIDVAGGSSGLASPDCDIRASPDGCGPRPADSGGPAIR